MEERMRMDTEKVCFIVCWLGKLPAYLPIWLKTCGYNKAFDFLLFTDDEISVCCPSNVKVISFSKEIFLSRVRERIYSNPSLVEDHSFWSHDGYKVLDDGYLQPVDEEYADQKKVFDVVGRQILENA